MLFTLRRTLSYSEFSDGIWEQSRSLQMDCAGPCCCKILAMCHVWRGTAGAEMARWQRRSRPPRPTPSAAAFFVRRQLSKFNVGAGWLHFRYRKFKDLFVRRKSLNGAKIYFQNLKSNTQGIMVHVQSANPLFSGEIGICHAYKQSVTRLVPHWMYYYVFTCPM